MAPASIAHCTRRPPVRFSPATDVVARPPRPTLLLLLLLPHQPALNSPNTPTCSVSAHRTPNKHPAPVPKAARAHPPVPRRRFALCTNYLAGGGRWQAWDFGASIGGRSPVDGRTDLTEGTLVKGPCLMLDATTGYMGPSAGLPTAHDARHGP